MANFRDIVAMKRVSILSLAIIMAIGLAVPLTAVKPVKAASCMNGCYSWRITGKTREPNYRGAWQFCVNWYRSARAATVTCSIGHSSSHTVTTTVGGTLEVGAATLNAAVGYDATRTTDVSAGYQYSAPARSSGSIQWAAVYGYHYQVRQEAYQVCSFSVGRGGHVTCTSIPASKRPVKYAYTKKYLGPTFRAFTN